MDYKKILAIVIIICFALVIVGSVQAESSGTKTTIRGIDFIIPDGYEESDYSVKDEVSDIATTDIMIYSGDDGVFSIMVIEYKDSIGLEKLIKGENTTIKNVTGGLLEEDDGSYTFYYVNDTSLIEISANDKGLIEDIII